MASPTTSPSDAYRLRWSRGGHPLAEVPRIGSGTAAESDADQTDADLVAADDAAPAGTLQAFVDSSGATRGRVSLAEPVEVGLTFLRPARLHLETNASTPGRPNLVAVVAEFADHLPFLRFAISGVTAPVVTEFSDSAVTVALAPGEYFSELRAALTAAEASATRPLNRRTHFTARPPAAFLLPPD